jgi:FMN-dependent NADH-azoreductase
VNPALDEFAEVAALMHKTAEQAATEAGSALAEKHAA